MVCARRAFAVGCCLALALALEGCKKEEEKKKEEPTCDEASAKAALKAAEEEAKTYDAASTECKPPGEGEDAAKDAAAECMCKKLQDAKYPLATFAEKCAEAAKKQGETYT